MNQVPREKLVELVARFGKEVCDDARRCEALLRDLCGDQYKREVSGLIGAVKEQVASELAADLGGIPKEALLARLSARLHDNLGLTEDLARWSVETWALALGVGERKDITCRFSCPSCNHVAKILMQLAGKRVRCPKCRTAVQVSDDGRSFTVLGGKHTSNGAGSSHAQPGAAEDDPFAAGSSVTPEELLRFAIRRVLADGVITEQEKIEIQSLRSALGIATDTASRLYAEERARVSESAGAKSVPRSAPDAGAPKQVAAKQPPPRLLAQPRKLHELAGHTQRVGAASFSPDGRRVLTGSWDNTARLWDAETGRLLRTLEGHTYSVNAAPFSPDGRVVLTGSDDKTARLWDAETGRLLRTLEGHTYSVEAASFSPDGRWVVTGSADDTARLWEAETGRLLRTLKGHTYRVMAASFSPDGQRVLTGSWDHTARLWDTATGKLLRTLKGHTAGVNSTSFSPDGRVVVTGSSDNTARLWDTATGRLLRTLKGHTAGVNSASFSPDGRVVVTGSSDNTARLWDVETGVELARIDAGQSVSAASFSPDGLRGVLGAGTWDHNPAKRRGEGQIWQVAEEDSAPE